ncbi:MAG: hypothetical protein IKG27_05905 [Bacilli bacterium]|nr:hypothetical protein [Bacilli bacterium]
MKLLKGEDIMIYINKEYLKKDFTENKIEELIKEIIKNYNINLKGYYNVKIYKDEKYGIIINISKEELEYLDYFNNEVNLNIEMCKDSFLYKIYDLYSIKNILKKLRIRKYNDSFYIEPKDITNVEFGIILENSIIIYGNEANKIKNKSDVLEVIV